VTTVTSVQCYWSIVSSSNVGLLHIADGRVTLCV